jgi:hypothetical protein
MEAANFTMGFTATSYRNTSLPVNGFWTLDAGDT